MENLQHSSPVRKPDISNIESAEQRRIVSNMVHFEKLLEESWKAVCTYKRQSRSDLVSTNTAAEFSKSGGRESESTVVIKNSKFFFCKMKC